MRRNLSPLARKVLYTLTVEVKPRREGFDLPVEGELVDFVDRFTSYFAPHLKVGFRIGLYLMEFLPIVLIGRWGRFTRLAPLDRGRYVAAWVHSPFPPFRDLMKGVKGLVAAAFYDRPEVWDHLGYTIEDHIAQVNAHPHVPAAQTRRLSGGLSREPGR